jgi:hypothetical protein
MLLNQSLHPYRFKSLAGPKLSDPAVSVRRSSVCRSPVRQFIIVVPASSAIVPKSRIHQAPFHLRHSVEQLQRSIVVSAIYFGNTCLVRKSFCISYG